MGATLAAGITACSSEQPIPENSTVIRVGAEVNTEVRSRTYYPEGAVTTGQFYLTYHPNSTSYSVATVDFDKSMGAGFGIVTTPAGTELEWGDILGANSQTFFLDNVPTTLGIGTTGRSTLVELDNLLPGANPFIAAPFDSINGTNDLLWGRDVETRGASTLNFSGNNSLNHMMSKVMVQVQVANSEFGDIDLSNATIVLTNICQTPLTYDRTTGVLDLGENPEGADLTIVGGDSGQSWNSAVRTSSDENVCYTSASFVVPPQSLAIDQTRTQLIIYVNDEENTVYSGYLPYAMELENGYPMALSFLSSYSLLIRTMITPDAPELVFMPVQVINWVNKGSYPLESRQAGIYTTREFLNMMSQYYPNYNSYQMAHYGFTSDPDNGPWYINIRRALELNYDDIYNKMPLYTNPDGVPVVYSFNSHRYVIQVTYSDGSVKNVTDEELLSITSGGTLPLTNP